MNPQNQKTYVYYATLPAHPFEQEVVAAYRGGLNKQQIAVRFNIVILRVSFILDKHRIPLRSASELNREAKKATYKGTSHIPGALYVSWRNGAKARRLPFQVDIEDLEGLWERQQGQCYYTGLRMHTALNAIQTRNLVGDPFAVSLDRKDSSLSYTIDNLCLCCMSVNLAKSAYSEQAFHGAIKDLRLHYRSSPICL